MMETIADFNELFELIKKLSSSLSEYSVANLYLFRRQHEYKLIKREGYTFLKGVTYDKTRYLMPFARLQDIGLPLLKEVMRQEEAALFPIPKEDLTLFPPEEFECGFNIDDSDYIYHRLKIADLPGRYLHKKRNLIKQYRTLYKYEDLEYSARHEAAALEVLDAWFKLAGTALEDTDYTACTEALQNFDELKLKGRVYFADDKPSGFLLGEELNPSMFVIHFAKGITEFKGIYPHMYNSLANSTPVYEFINFEQDLGKESLRQAKSTYLQDAMLDKYRVKLKVGA